VTQNASGLRGALAHWAEAWDLAGFEQRLDVRFSKRFCTSLGRCRPDTGEIRLAEFLLTGPPALLRETLCHEAAHAAVYVRHGRGRKPHGTEWRALMQAAGFEARARLPAHLVADVVRPRARRRRLWQHRCPVCHASRTARRRVPQWRCAACRAMGLEGALLITELGGLAARWP